jgi:hypothetical protein
MAWQDWITPVVGGALGLFGQKAASDSAQRASDASVAAAAIAADAAKFKPYGVTTGFGQSWFDTENNTAGYDLDPALAAYRDQLMSMGAEALPSSMDPTANAQQYYNEMQAMAAPGRQQQMQDMRQDVFGSGRLGMRLAGEAAGAGANAGMVNPDFFGMNASNAMADQQMQLLAREKSMAELDASINRGTGLFTSGFGVEELGMKPLGIGAEIGGRASTAGANAGQYLMGGAQGAAQANLASGLGWANTMKDMGLGLMKFRG